MSLDNRNSLLYIYFIMLTFFTHNSLETIMRALLHYTIVVLVALPIITMMGCKKDSSPTGTSTPPPISGDLFPIVEGHLYIYNEYETDAQSQKISGTDYRVATMVGPSVTVAGRSGNYLIDSVYSPDGNFLVLDTLITAQKGMDGTIYFTLPPNLLQDFPISITFPPIWLPFFQPVAGVGVSYVIYSLDTTVTYQTLPLRIQLSLSGVINQKENVQVPAGTYSAYRGELNYDLTATSGSVTLYRQNGNVLTMWLCEDIGPVKISWAPLGTSMTGSARELVSKNFN